MLQQDTPDDYVIATGTTHTVRELARSRSLTSASTASATSCRRALLPPGGGRPFRRRRDKARRELGWTPLVAFEQLVAMMVDADLARLSGGG